MTEQTIAVIGIGKLGAPMAACLASRGYAVVAADTDAAKVAALNAGEAPVFEPGLAALIGENRTRIRATQSVAEAAQAADTIFLVLPTPSDAQGEFSLDFVLPACREVGQALRERTDFPVVVLTSTVMPGATGGPVRRALEESSGARCGREFGLCYSPEFIALGSVIHDFLNPDLALIGESDARAGDRLAALYEQVCASKPPVARTNFVNAEVAKLSINTFVTTKISYANMLAQVCERLPGADAEAVTQVLGLDSRIGRKYLRAATGYGGPCFPRDNVAFIELARRLGEPARLAEATHAINGEQAGRLARRVLSLRPPGGRVAVLGLAYKPQTDVVTESQGVALARLLAAQGVPVSVYDPAGLNNARPLLGEGVTLAPSLEDCLEDADVLVLTTPWDEFKSLTPERLARPGRPRILLDCWRLLDSSAMRGAVEYHAPGLGPTGKESTDE